ncbi:MAG TPA: hypothetical protein VF471_07780 [Pseudoxanthomonas sp.]
MRQGTPGEPGYFLPEEAHQQLQSLRHHLHLLAELSQPEILNPDHLILPRAGLAHCFTQLAETADQIAANTTFQTARRRKPAQPE